MTDAAAPQRPTSSAPSPARRLAVVLAACGLAASLTVASEGTMLVGYRDEVGIVTACDGHTGAGAILGKRYEPATCKAFLDQDELKAGAGIDLCLKVEIPLRARAAFTDFAFNVGVGAFCGSTMARLVNAGDLAGACAQLPRWVYAGGKILPGLVTRRAKERALCEADLPNPREHT